MGRLKRVEEVAELEVGKYYLVPCVQAPAKFKGGFTKGDWIPTIGPMHSDPLLGAHFSHLHYDRRFIRDLFELELNNGAAIAMLWADGRTFPTAETPIVYRRKKCYRTTIGMPVDFAGDARKMLSVLHRDHAIDLACPRCPHQGIPLNGIEPVDGVICCPGHGLHWCASSGRLIEPD